MSTANFREQDDFPLYVLIVEDDDDYDIIYDDLERELENVNNHLLHDNVDDYEIVLKDGYYSGIQLYVEGEFDSTGYKSWGLEQEGLSEEEIADELENMYVEEIDKVNNALRRFAKENGFRKLKTVGRFSNGEAFYEYDDDKAVLSSIYDERVPEYYAGYNSPDYYDEDRDELSPEDLDDDELIDRYKDYQWERDWDELVSRDNNNLLESALGNRDEEIYDPIENDNDYSVFEKWELRDYFLPWLEKYLEKAKNKKRTENVKAAKKDIAKIKKLLGKNKKSVNANKIIKMINQFEKEGPNPILSQSVQSDRMKNDYFKVKNLYEKVQDTMDRNGYELSDDDIQNITNQLLDTFEGDVRFQKLNAMVDNMNDFLSYIISILGTSLGFLAVISNITNQIHIKGGVSLTSAWIFGLILSLISFSLKIMSTYLTKKKFLKNMW